MHNDATVCKALLTIDFWLLFAGTFCVMGSALMTINNVSNIPFSFFFSRSFRGNLTYYFVSFLLLFLPLVLVLFYSTQVSQMVSAMNATNSALFVSLIGVSHCMGRMIGGLVANVTRKCISRAWWIVVFSVVMALGQALIAVGNLYLLYPAMIFTGMA